MQWGKWTGILLSICCSTFAIAAEQVVKENTTPPAAEGALTVEQIPSLNSLDKPAVIAPAQAAPVAPVENQQVGTAPAANMPVTAPAMPLTNSSAPAVAPPATPPVNAQPTATKTVGPLTTAENTISDDDEGILNP